MSDPKSLQRLLAVQALYQISINELSNENSFDTILEEAMHQPGLEELKKKPNYNYAKKIHAKHFKSKSSTKRFYSVCRIAH